MQPSSRCGMPVGSCGPLAIVTHCCRPLTDHSPLWAPPSSQGWLMRPPHYCEPLTTVNRSPLWATRHCGTLSSQRY
ncbi:unnamed protein product [Ixodes persulcatus]